MKNTIPLNDGIDKIGDLYENIKDNIRALEFGYATEQNKIDIYNQLVELRDIACNVLKTATVPNIN